MIDSVTWQDFEGAHGDLAGRVRARFEATGLGLIATLRRDGSPRISGVEPLFGLGHVWLGMMPGSLKAKDLQRDARCALHAATADKEMREGDAKIAGVVIEVTDAAERTAYEKAFSGDNGYDPSATGPYHLFRLLVTEVVHLSIAPERDAMLIERWAPGMSEPVVMRRT